MAIYKKRQGIRLAVPLEERLLERIIKSEGFCLCQPKLDGERCRAVVMNPLIPDEASVVLLSSEANIIPHLPHINSAVLEYWKSLPSEFKGLVFEFDGELFCKGMPFEEIHSIVSRKKNPHKKALSIKYHLFDLPMPGDEVFRQAALSNTAHLMPVALERVRTVWANTVEQAYECYNEFCADGYEGVIFRSPRGLYYRGRTQTMLKFKPKKEDTYVCAGVEEAVSEDGTPLGRAGALICYAEYNVEDKFRVGLGAGVDHSIAKWLFEYGDYVIGRLVKVQYQNLTVNGVPRFGKFVSVVD